MFRRGKLPETTLACRALSCCFSCVSSPSAAASRARSSSSRAGAPAEPPGRGGPAAACAERGHPGITLNPRQLGPSERLLCVRGRGGVRGRRRGRGTHRGRLGLLQALPERFHLVLCQGKSLLRLRKEERAFRQARGGSLGVSGVLTTHRGWLLTRTRGISACDQCSCRTTWAMTFCSLAVRASISTAAMWPMELSRSRCAAGGKQENVLPRGAVQLVCKDSGRQSR